jgi:hypothetical protein
MKYFVPSILDKRFKVFLQDYPSIELNKSIYKNISNSGLHWIASKTPVLPCPGVIEWMTRRIDHESRTILNFEDNHASSYQSLVLNRLYHFKESHEKVTPEWLKDKNENIDFLSIMKGWCSKGKFRAKSSPVEWRTSKFRKSIQIIVILLARVFERKYASSFLEKWITIIHQVITHR